MQEEDTCRICSFPGDSEQPLFHPCKCSGTIRYIHQDCLTTWLAHSKKKTCDVCKYQYSFTKVYSPNMPKQIPFILFLRKFAHQLLRACLFGLRGTLVTVIWLAFLPYVTVWTWRFYFISGENIAWWINDRPRPPPSSVFSSYYAHNNATEYDGNEASNSTALNPVVIYPLLKALSSDIFTGQIIASLIVFAFLGVFLLREWIIQNARPGVFEDNAIEHVQEEVDGGPIHIPDPVILDAQVEIENQEERDQPVEGDTSQVTDSHMRGSSSSEPILLDLDGDRQHDSHLAHLAPGMSFDVSDSSEIRNSGEDAQSTDAVEPPSRRRRLLREAAHQRYKRPSRRSRSQSWSRHTHYDRRNFTISRSSDSISPNTLGSIQTHSADNGDTTAEDFQFTFTIRRPRRTSLVSLPNLSDDTAFSLRPPDSGFATSQLSQDDENDWEGRVSTSSRRPPLHNSTLNLENINNALGSNDTQRQSPSPFPSPGIASYHAPEEFRFDAGPSQPMPGPSSLNNTDEETSSSANTAVEEYDDYFRDRNDSEDEADLALPPPIENIAVDVEARRLPDPEPRNMDQVPPDAQGQDEEMNANMEDDIDGALEAIGMRGPVTTVFQNAALMIFVLDTTMGVGIWFPFIIGKTTALLSLEPVRIIHILHWPIRVIRVVTDPMVDLLFSLLRRAVLPFVMKIVHGAAILLSFSQSAVLRLPIFFFHSEPSFGEKTKIKMSDILSQQPASIFSIIGSPSLTGGNSTYLAAFEKAVETPLGQVLEVYFAKLGKFMREHATSFKTSWYELSYGDGSIHKIFAICLGYLVFGLLVALYLNILNVGNVQSAGRAIRSAIRQQLIVIKVAVFIVVELVVFPLGCGVLLDLYTLPLFPNASIGTRLVFLSHAPVTAIFYDWMIGTMFMYQFAILLSDCRKVMRPGAMWFIKDPQDQNFHPIRDILDRPALVQLRKLVVSAMMYSVVVACSAGGIVFGLRIWRPAVLPLRWNMRQPISEIPIDLLFIHLALPATLRYFRPKKLAMNLVNKYWRWAAHQLRLTSYMFGDRRPTEEVASTWSIRSVLSSLSCSEELPKGEPRWEGTFRRVPAADNIALPKEIRATVAVHEDGSPLDEASKNLMEQQNAEADKARRDVKEDYMIVYLPPHFKQRIILFIGSLWIAGSIVVVAALAAPIVIGRAFFKLFSDQEAHDAYSFVAGFYLLWGSIVGGTILDRMDKRRQRTGGEEPRGEWAVYVFKQGVMWIGKSAWLLFWMGIVIPILTALVMELYVIHPMKLILNPEASLRIRVVDQWAIGLIYAKIAMTSMHLRPETRLDAAIKRFTEGSWRYPDAMAATREIIAPVAIGLIGVIVFPMVVVAGLQHYIPAAVSDKSLFLYVYPGIFVIACFARITILFESLFGGWAQAIRDSEFLVEMRLRNLEPAPAVKMISTSSSDVSAASQTSNGTTVSDEAVAQ